MSFFFTKERPKPVRRGGTPAKLTQAGQASKDSLNRLGCKACPLDKADNCTPKMKPVLFDETDIYILGDQPNHEDDKRGIPFASKAGKLLTSLLDIDGNYSFDNVIRDFDHDYIAPSWVAMEACRGLVTKSIERAKPKLLLGLGILPLQWMLKSSDMVGLRGRVFAVQVGSHKCWFLPTYHPQYILDTAYDDSQPLRSKLGHCLKFDVARAISLANSLPTPTIDTPQGARGGIQCFNGTPRASLGALLRLISEARKAPEKAIDLECDNLSPFRAGATVLTVAISFGDTNFAFALDHPKSGWSEIDKGAIKLWLAKLLSDKTTIIAHNAPFECSWLVFLLGKDVIWHDNWECTMMQSHFLDERRGKRGGHDEQFQPNPYQALDFLVRQHFGIAFKALFKLDRKNMARADLDETLLYNGADAKYTLRLFHNQTDRLRAMGLHAAYREAVARQPTVALMQSIGIDIDRKQNKTMQTRLGGEIAEIEKRIKGYPEVQRFIADRKTFNISSSVDVLSLLKGYVKGDTSLLNSEGKESVDKAILQRLHHPIGKDIEEFRNRSKLKSTYVDEFEFGKGSLIWPDGKIHPSVNTTFAETGRTSSDGPNQQNWPKRGKGISVRKQQVPPKGHVFVSLDYGQLEGCTGAMCSKDKVFIKALWEDYDMHMEWAQRAAFLYPAYIGGKHMLTDKATMKTFRSLVKNKLVFPAFFGAAEDSVAGYLTAATGVEAPKTVIKQLFTEFWKYFNGVHTWQKRLMNDYYENGYVESPTGRRHHYPLSRPQAINYPIQSVACDITCRAMVRLSIIAADTDAWYLHPIMNIHDDLTFAIPDDPQILEEAIEIIYRVMLNPGYDFINVPMSVECSIGDNWLEMKEIGKFYSNKDL